MISLDANPRSRATICSDILAWKYERDYPSGHFTLVATSPPDLEGPTAKGKEPLNMSKGDALICRVLKIIKYFQPKAWWIENPRGSVLNHREFMKGIPYVDIDYCQVSDWGFQKPTRFWCSDKISTLTPLICDDVGCPNTFGGAGEQAKHICKGGGAMGDKQRIPFAAVDYLLTGFELKATPPPCLRFTKRVSYPKAQFGKACESPTPAKVNQEFVSPKRQQPPSSPSGNSQGGCSNQPGSSR